MLKYLDVFPDGRALVVLRKQVRPAPFLPATWGCEKRGVRP